ncbi:hypothetical protein E2562_010175 [Oryza meyeriana var. granulata]|uniref:Uncharacterized protein n=1 Tax=Oryza meyeriana var. granulata TaxID=110450 RepID=A0A6G1EI74_9ORYZ|nr:hypothetical protein E2562_010175 [Oryza meyeriana var. granulata]
MEAAKVNYLKVRLDLQPDAIIRDGVPDLLEFVSLAMTVDVVDVFHQPDEPNSKQPPLQRYTMMAMPAQSLTRGFKTALL